MVALRAGETIYTRSVKDLIKRIHDVSPLHDSIYEQAAQFFTELPDQLARIEKLKNKIEHAQQQRANTRRKQVIEVLEDEIKGWKIELKQFERQLDDERIKRRHQLVQVCMDILALLEGENFDEEAMRSAKLLGTLFLILPDEGSRRKTLNQRAKPLYEATLSLRLLEQLVSSGVLKESYVLAHLPDNNDKEEQCAQSREQYRHHLAIPLIMASILHDIGRMHPDAQRILRGSDGNLDEYRILTRKERDLLLKIVARKSLLYLRDGIGMDRYVGNSRAERDEFDFQQKRIIAFTHKVLKQAYLGQPGVGDLIKVPQVYTSVVLSTKPHHKIEQTPLVMVILKRSAEKGVFTRTGVGALLKIVGVFPQGYGVAYIPKGANQDRYEYAVVNGLYPSNIEEPICRTVTRHLKYTHSGQPVVVNRSHNLFFKHARQQLEKVDRARLLKILEQLCSNFDERKEMDLIPRCWHPYHYFANEKHQQLWLKSSLNQE